MLEKNIGICLFLALTVLESEGALLKTLNSGGGLPLEVHKSHEPG
jgi:hypothetical protein